MVNRLIFADKSRNNEYHSFEHAQVLSLSEYQFVEKKGFGPMIIELILFAVAGILIGYILHFLIVPEARVFEPWGVFVLAVLGAIIGGISARFLGIFNIPFIFAGSVLLALLTAVFLVLLAGLGAMMFTRTDNQK